MGRLLACQCVYDRPRSKTPQLRHGQYRTLRGGGREREAISIALLPCPRESVCVRIFDQNSADRVCGPSPSLPLVPPAHLPTLQLPFSPAQLHHHQPLTGLPARPPLPSGHFSVPVSTRRRRCFSLCMTVTPSVHRIV